MDGLNLYTYEEAEELNPTPEDWGTGLHDYPVFEFANAIRYPEPRLAEGGTGGGQQR